MRIVGLIFIFAMVISLLVAFSLTASAAEGTAIDLSSLTGTYVISDSGEYIFTGSGSSLFFSYKIQPELISITIALGVSIEGPSGQ